MSSQTLILFASIIFHNLYIKNRYNKKKCYFPVYVQINLIQKIKIFLKYLFMSF